MTRVFVAIDLPDDVKEKIQNLDNALLKSKAELNIVNPDISHITLKFIGDADEKMIEEIKKVLLTINYKKFKLSLSGISFNNNRSPRIIWADGYDDGKSSSLAGMIDNKLASLDIKEETRPYKIHTTIARIKRYHPSLKHVVREIENTKLGEFEVTGFKLKKSKLTPQGPIYEDLMEVLF